MIYFIFGVRRSGNHAIIGWLYGLLNNEYVHMNCVEDINLANFVKFANMKSEKIYSDYDIIPFGKSPNTIFSFENKSINFIDHITKHLNEKGIPYKIILIVRDPLNQYASWFKTYAEIEGNLTTNYEYILDTMINVPESKNTVYIQYVRWNNDRNYRDAVAAKIGLVNKDVNFNECIGHGISFFENGKNIDHNLYDKRWLVYKNLDIYNNSLDKNILIKWKTFQQKYNVAMDKEYNDHVDAIIKYKSGA